MIYIAPDNPARPLFSFATSASFPLETLSRLVTQRAPGLPLSVPVTRYGDLPRKISDHSIYRESDVPDLINCLNRTQWTTREVCVLRNIRIDYLISILLLLTLFCISEVTLANKIFFSVAD